MTIHISDEQAVMLGELIINELIELKFDDIDPASPDDPYVRQLLEIGDAVGAEPDWDALTEDRL